MVIMTNIVNFDDVKETKYIEDEGNYLVKVIKFEAKDSKAGNPMHVYTLATQDGAQIRLFLSLSEKAMFKYKAFVRAVKNIPEGEKLGAIDLDTFSQQALNKKLMIDVVIESVKRMNIETGTEEYIDLTNIAKTYAVEQTSF